MTGWKWVLLRGLPGMLGMLGMLNLAFGVDSASLSGLKSANETGHFRVCANICEADPAGKPCDLFCTSRRQFTIQSNTVAGERDVDVGVEETRRDACPTLCRLLFCTCDSARTQDPEGPQYPPVPVQVVANPPWKRVCKLLCKAELPVNHNCPECPKSENPDIPTKNNEKVSIRSGSHQRSLMDFKVTSATRGASSNPSGASEEAGERDGVGMVEFGTGERRRTTEGGNPVDRMQDDFDREEFCRIECARGNGGLACDCDVIP